MILGATEGTDMRALTSGEGATASSRDIVVDTDVSTVQGAKESVSDFGPYRLPIASFRWCVTAVMFRYRMPFLAAEDAADGKGSPSAARLKGVCWSSTESSRKGFVIAIAGHGTPTEVVFTVSGVKSIVDLHKFLSHLVFGLAHFVLRDIIVRIELSRLSAVFATESKFQ